MGLSLKHDKESDVVLFLGVSGLNTFIWFMHIFMEGTLLEEFTSHVALGIIVFFLWLGVFVASIMAMKSGAKSKLKYEDLLSIILLIFVAYLALDAIAIMGVDSECQVQKRNSSLSETLKTKQDAIDRHMKGYDVIDLPPYLKKTIDRLKEDLANLKDTYNEQLNVSFVKSCKNRYGHIFSNIGIIFLYYFGMLCQALYKV